MIVVRSSPVPKRSASPAAAQLVAREAPAQNGGADVAEAGLLLRMDADVVAIDVVGRLLRRPPASSEARRRFELAPGSAPPSSRGGGRGTSAAPARGSRGARRVAEDLGDRRGRPAAPDPQRTKASSLTARCGSVERPPPTRTREADLAVAATHGRQADVVDLGIRAPDAAAGDRDLELARQVVELGVADRAVRVPRRASGEASTSSSASSRRAGSR